MSRPGPPARCQLTLGQQSCSGISFKSQALYFFVYATRYLGQEMHRRQGQSMLMTPRSLLVLYGQRLEHDFQDYFSVLVRIYPLRDAERLQTDT